MLKMYDWEILGCVRNPDEDKRLKKRFFGIFVVELIVDFLQHYVNI